LKTEGLSYTAANAAYVLDFLMLRAHPFAREQYHVLQAFLDLKPTTEVKR
jgi:hypothetical protein